MSSRPTPSTRLSGGGYLNSISTNADSSAISGGERNSIAGNAQRASIAGGYQNDIGTDASSSAIGGGRLNKITADSAYAVVAGGYGNVLGTNASYSALGGGSNNNIVANAQFGVIPGGRDNSATNYGFAAGRRAKANHTGAFVWADSTDLNFASTATNQFLIRASGGVGIGATNLTGVLYLREPVGAPADSMSSKDNGLGLGSDGTNSYKWMQSYGGALALNPLSNNVGIGLQNPSEKLHVNGNIRASGSVIASCGTLTCSDARYKTNVCPVEHGLDLVRRLQPVRFDWRREEFPQQQFDRQRQVGLIAQQVKAVAPEIVQEGSDGYLAVDYARLTPLLIEAVKEQQEQIEARDREMAAIKKELAELRALAKTAPR